MIYAGAALIYIHTYSDQVSPPSPILASVCGHLFSFDRHVIGRESFKVILIWISLVASGIKHL